MQHRLAITLSILLLGGIASADNPQQHEDFAVGGAFFQQPWVTAPASTTARDGLGPLFRANACLACHVGHGRGHPPLTEQEPFLSTVVKLGIPPRTPQQQGQARTLGTVPDPVYGEHLQPLGIKGLPGEGTPRLTYTPIHGQFKDGEAYTLLQPRLHIEQPQYGAFAEGIQFSVRVAPPLFGIGILESVPEVEILALADPEDKDGDGISGQPNRVWDIATNSTVLGRFGWKANQPNIRQQTADALRNDIGITTTLLPTQPCTAAQGTCQTLPDGGKPEFPDDLLDKLVFHTRHQGTPQQRDPTDPQVAQGQRLFMQSGCAGCHVPAFPSLAKQDKFPYTDLLLHDMGEGLADHRPEFAATGREWRTPPLWGIGLTAQINGHTRFLHDGRARNLLEAILWHGGEAEQTKQNVLALTKQERAALIRFLESL